jgi:hypothetical protein
MKISHVTGLPPFGRRTFTIILWKKGVVGHGLKLMVLN